MICPKCGKGMKKGYIQSRDGIYWDSKIRIIAALGSLSPSSISLSSEETGAFSGNYVDAFLCTSCKKIIIDY